MDTTADAHLFGSQHNSYDFKVHVLILPHAAEDVIARTRAGVTHQKITISTQQLLRTLHKHTNTKTTDTDLYEDA